MNELLGQAKAIADPSPWAEYGLPGLVILALFVLFGFVVRWAAGHIDTQAKTHREERAEWRQSSEKLASEFCGTIEKASENFANTVKEISNK